MSLGENLVRIGRKTARVAQVQLHTEDGSSCKIHLFWNFRLGSAAEANICSHCYSVSYMKIPAIDEVIFLPLIGMAIIMLIVTFATYFIPGLLQLTRQLPYVPTTMGVPRQYDLVQRKLLTFQNPW